MIAKLVLVSALITLLADVSLVADANYRPQVNSITGVVIAQEKDEDTYSTGFSFNYRGGGFDEFRFSLPFDFDARIGYISDGWKAGGKGKKFRVVKQDGVTSPENNQSFESVNLRLDFNEIRGTEIQRRLREGVKFQAFADGKKIEDGKMPAVFLPPFEPGSQITVPDQVASQGGLFATLNDAAELVVLNAVMEQNFGDLWRVKPNAALNRGFPVGGKVILKPENTNGQRSESIPANIQVEVDSKGVKTRPTRVTFESIIPAGVKPGTGIGVTYTSRFGLSSSAALRVNSLAHYPQRCEPRLVSCAKYGLAGQLLCACGCFETDDGLKSARTGWYLDNEKAISPSAVASKKAVFFLPEDIEPGFHRLEWRAPRKPYSVDFVVLKVAGSIDQNKLWTGQGTRMTLRIIGTEESLKMEITNRTPKVISIDGGKSQYIPTSGGKDNKIVKGVKGIRRGNFKIDYKLSIGCDCKTPELD